MHPLPSEIILPFAGYLVSLGKMNLFWAATVGALGCNVGSAGAYAVGRHGGRQAVEQWGKYVLVTEGDLDRADRFFDRFGGLAVLLARILPVVRTFIAMPAGMARMPRVKFHIYTFIGSWPWCFVLTYVGMLLGRRWASNPKLSHILHYADYVIVGVVLVVVGRFVWSRWGMRHSRADED